MAARIVLSVTHAKAQSVLEGLIADGERLRTAAQAVHDEQSFDEWRREAKRWGAYIRSALQTICVGDALVEDFDDASSVGVAFIAMGPVPLGKRLEERVADHLREIDALRSIDDRLALFEASAGIDETDEPPAGSSLSPRVFVVHGRQRDSADVVARLLTKLDLEPVILDEQANEGRTILEKLEANTENVGFAVVLLQADDHGRGPDRSDWPAEPNRARQNVILELGFFVGKIGRARVAALVESTVEQPSDILGLAYINFDDSWQLRLARELKHAYPDLDLNLVA